MFDRYLRILESFKEHQLSVFLNGLRAKIIDKVAQELLSPELKPYLTPKNDGVPFIDFNHEPKQIIQIKKIINALYYAECAFKDLENLNARSAFELVLDLNKIFATTIDYAYEASILLTTLDLNIYEIFHEEITILKKIANAVEIFASKDSDKPENKDLGDEFASIKSLISYIKPYVATEEKKEETTEQPKKPERTLTQKAIDYSYKAGHAAGVTVYQMKPEDGSYDYKYITNFSGEKIPDKIEEITKKLNQYTNDYAGDLNATLGEARKKALKDDAVSLLHAINEIQNLNFFNSYKMVNYIYIIQHIITISTTILEQTDFLTDKTQDAICAKLAELKYNWFLKLFATIDKAEEEALLIPGTISTPLIKSLDALYSEVTYYAKKVVNFSVKGEELLTIEDQHFVDLRIENIKKRISETYEKEFKAIEAEKAFASFYELFEKTAANEYKTFTNISSEKQEKLIEYYQLVQPYFNKLNLELGIKIANIINVKSSASANECFKQLAVNKKSFENLIKSEINSQQFHRKLSENLIENINQRTQTELHPFNSDFQRFHYIEKDILEHLQTNALKATIVKVRRPLEFAININKFNQVELDKLSHEEATLLFYWYNREYNRLLKGYECLKEFTRILTSFADKELYNLEDNNKETLKNLYKQIQPYLVSALVDMPMLADFDKTIISNLAKPSIPEKKLTAQSILDVLPQVTEKLVVAKEFCNRQEKTYGRLSSCTAQKKLVLSHPYQNRANYIIKDPYYAKAINEFRENVYHLTHAFNQSVKKQLNPAKEGIPFPELMDGNKKLTECDQIINIKRFYNGLYNLEHLANQLQKLRSDGYKTKYVYHLLNVYSHLDNLIDLCDEFIINPHLNVVGSQLLMEALKIKAAIVQETDPYVADVSHLPGSEQYPSMWLALQAMMIVPKHIAALNNNESLSQRELEVIQAKTEVAVQKINTIIENSNSYFRLLLKTPMMYALFNELRGGLNDFCSISHDAVKSRLGDIQTRFFSQILIETDRWEDQMCLQPGLLSDPMKLVLDQFYHGLLEPLDLESEVHVGFITNNAAFENRKKANNDRKQRAMHEKNNFANELALLNELDKAIGEYQFEYSPWIYWLNDDANIKAAEIKLEKAYRNAHFILMENAHRAIKSLDYPAENVRIDNFIHLKTVPVIETVAVAEQIIVNEIINNDAPTEPEKISPPEIITDLNSSIELDNDSDSTQTLSSTSSSFDDLISSTELDSNEKIISEQSSTTNFIPFTSPFDRRNHKFNFDEKKIITHLDKKLSCITEDYSPEFIFSSKELSSEQRAELSYEQIQQLNEWYHAQVIELQAAADILEKLDILEKFISLLPDGEELALMSLPEEKKQIFRDMYLQIQPYYISALAENVNVNEFDQDIINNLSSSTPALTKPVTIKDFLNTAGQVSTCIQHALTFCQKQEQLYQVKLPDIKSLVATVRSYYQGKHNALELNIDIALEKEAYLNTLQKNQEDINKQYIKEYAFHYFDQYLESIKMKRSDLFYANDEYYEKLKNYLIGLTEEISRRSIENPNRNIKKNIAEMIQQQINIFQKTNLKYYSQLNNILSATNAFEQYFAEYLKQKNSVQKNSVYETPDLINEKSAKIADLKKIANNKEIDIADRIKMLRKIVSPSPFQPSPFQPSPFEQTILKRKNKNSLSNTLIRCFLRLLSALNLYTPEHEKHYNTLKDATSKVSKLKTNRHDYHGFFAASKKDIYEEPDILPANNFVLVN